MGSKKHYAGQISEKLQDLRSKGLKDGGVNRPPPDAAGLSQHESAAKSEAEKWLNSEQRIFDQHMTEAARGMTEAQHKEQEYVAQAEMLTRDDSLSGSVQAELAGDRRPLVEATAARLEAEASIRYYKAANEIDEPATYPESRIWHLGLLAVIALVEVVINAFFYENAQGLLGGLVVAAGIAVVSLGFSALLGWVFRFKNLCQFDKRLLGWSALVVFVILSIFGNALFAAFRSEYQLVVDPSEVGQVREAFQVAWSEATGIFYFQTDFKDLLSLVLFGLGVLANIWAFAKGYTIDDRYPGYGARDRRFQETNQTELTLQDALRAKVKDLLQARRVEVQKALSAPRDQVGLISRRTAEVANAKSALTAAGSAIQRDYAMVIEAYRQANVSVRMLSTPGYFKEPVALASQVSVHAADTLLAEFGQLQEQVRLTGERFSEDLTCKLNELQDAQSEVFSRTFGDYLESVRAEAEEQLTRRIQVLQRELKAA